MTSCDPGAHCVPAGRLVDQLNPWARSKGFVLLEQSPGQLATTTLWVGVGSSPLWGRVRM